MHHKTDFLNKMGSLQAPPRDSAIFSYSYLATVNLITMGTELCTSAAFSYLPPLLLEAGFSESGMSTVMATGPFLALFLLPVMGTASDQCRSRYGRRRPFIFLLSLGIISSLILIPNVRSITAMLGNLTSLLAGKEIALMLLASSVVLLDFCSQVSYTPIESLLSDPCNSEFHRNRSFGIFSLMMSSGACLGYWIVSVNWSETEIGEYFGGQQRTLFVILLVSFTTTLFISLLVAHDPPLDSIAAESAESKPSSNHNHNHSAIPQVQSIQDGKVQSDGTMHSTHVVIAQDTKPMMTAMSVPPSIARLTPTMQLNCQSLLSCILPRFILGPIVDTVRGIRTMPKAMQTLWSAHLMTCMAVMGFRLYFTDYVGESIFHGNPESPAESLSRKAYENGVRMGSVGLLLHSILSAVFSLMIGSVISSWGSVHAYMFGMVMFTSATFLMLFFDNIVFILVLATFTGFANATITTVPYTVLTGYHQRKELYFQDSNVSDDLHGKGADLALLDSAYIMSEVISSFAFGIIVDVTKTTEAYILCSFICGLTSCFLVLRIK